jgi:hypothetical protein
MLITININIDENLFILNGDISDLLKSRKILLRLRRLNYFEKSNMWCKKEGVS